MNPRALCQRVRLVPWIFSLPLFTHPPSSTTLLCFPVAPAQGPRTRKIFNTPFVQIEGYLSEFCCSINDLMNYNLLHVSYFRQCSFSFSSFLPSTLCFCVRLSSSSLFCFVFNLLSPSCVLSSNVCIFCSYCCLLLLLSFLLLCKLSFISQLLFSFHCLHLLFTTAVFQGSAASYFVFQDCPVLSGDTGLVCP